MKIRDDQNQFAVARYKGCSVMTRCKSLEEVLNYIIDKPDAIIAIKDVENSNTFTFYIRDKFLDDLKEEDPAYYDEYVTKFILSTIKTHIEEASSEYTFDFC